MMQLAENSTTCGGPNSRRRSVIVWRPSSSPTPEWSPPRIAAHLGWHPHTARAVLKDFRERGLKALRPGKPGPPPDRTRHQRVTEALEGLLRQERTWDSG